ncbi:MAG TPA: hypothetical protein VLT33_10135 [Labilithrix sp.]|nr:hypothetical protein [Labilithrix sp.]
MTDAGAFLVEDFVHSIAAQLDRVQDALRLKAVNRPLTYALKDFSLDLHVFPELDATGHVRFRTAGANESGASTVHLAFTTITRPMIEENTVSLQASQGPGLEESGLDPEDQRRLEQLGVRNVTQLQKLQRQTGSSTLQRLAGVSADRLRVALERGRPAIDRISVRPAAPVRPGPAITPAPPAPKPAPAPPIRVTPSAPPPPKPVVAAPPATNPVRVRLEGRNFLGAGAPRATFDDRPVSIASLDDDAIEIDLPHASGALSLELGDGEVQVFAIAGPNGAGRGAVAESEHDPWGHG